MEPLLSIIVPIYNVEQYLERCIESIINQTYKNLEIILVDDGSKDNSGTIADTYASKDNRIKVIHKENGGLSDARNHGLDQAKGKYIIFIDSDDFIDSSMCEILFATAEKYSSDIVSCNYYIFQDENHISVHSMSIQEDEKVFSGIDILKYYLIKTEPFDLNIVCNKIFKADLFNSKDSQIRFPEGRVQEDNFTTFRLFAKSDVVTTINQPLYYYLQRADSIMANFSKKFVKDTIDSHTYMATYLLEHKVDVMCELQLYLLNSYTDLYRKICLLDNADKQDYIDLLMEYKTFVLSHTLNVSNNHLWGIKQKLKRFLIKIDLIKYIVCRG